LKIVKTDNYNNKLLDREELKRIEKYESNKKEEEARLIKDTIIKQKPWILYVFAVASALVVEVKMHTVQCILSLTEALDTLRLCRRLCSRS
jgi:hypothetical protein